VAVVHVTLKTLRQAATILLLGLILDSLAQVDVTMAPHWGAMMFPELSEKLEWGVTTLLFTQLNEKHQQYGIVYDDTALVNRGLIGSHPYYDKTIGFNILSLSKSGLFGGGTDAAMNNLLYRVGVGAGLNNDDFPRFFQNRIIHEGYRKLPTIPRDSVRCTGFGPECLDYSLSGEINYRFLNFIQYENLMLRATPIFLGFGGSINSIGCESFTQIGAIDVTLAPRLIRSITQNHLIFKFNCMSRIGAIFNNQITHPFRKINSGYVIHQAAIDMIAFPKAYPISIKNAFTSHSGLFLNSENQPIRELYWSINVSVGAFHVEQFNDMFNDKDFGPTFGARIYYDIVLGGAFDHKIDDLFSFIQSQFGD
jgi:hypothetical protein